MLNKKDFNNEERERIKQFVKDYFNEINTPRTELINSFENYEKKYEIISLSDRMMFCNLIRQQYYIKYFKIIMDICNIKKYFYLINSCNKKYNTTYALLSPSDTYKGYFEMKPYLNKNNHEGLLSKLIDKKSIMSNFIPNFAVNVSRILKGTINIKGFSLKRFNSNEYNSLNDKIKWISSEFALMLITTERSRNDRTNASIYYEFHRLKHTRNKDEAVEILEGLLNEYLIFTQYQGVKLIRERDAEYFWNRLDSLFFSNEQLNKKFEKMKSIIQYNYITSFYQNYDESFNSNECQIKIFVQPKKKLNVKECKLRQGYSIFKISE